MWSQDAELVVAEPEGLVDRADLAADHGCHGGQHPVPGLAAVGVLDPSQALDVEERDGERMSVASVLGDQDLEPFVELGVGREPGEPVAQRAAGPLADEPLGHRPLDRAEDLRQSLHRSREVGGLVLRARSAERFDQEGLQHREDARDLSRGALAPS